MTKLLPLPPSVQSRVLALQPATRGGKAGRSWYRVENAATEEATVYIYDQIAWYGLSADDFVRDLAAITAATINVRVNSPGGDVFHGVAIYNALVTHAARVVVHIDGLAASIASVIALAGEEIRMARGGFLMIHDPFTGVVGTAKELRAAADVLDKIRDSIADVYADRLDLDREEINQLMEAETWFSATEAKEAGLVDQVIGAGGESTDAVENRFDLSVYNRVPAELAARNAAGGRRGLETVRQFENWLRDEGGFSRSQAAAIARGGFKEASEPRDEDDEAETIAAMQRLIHSMNN